jgi:hypothetical protein
MLGAELPENENSNLTAKLNRVTRRTRAPLGLLRAAAFRHFLGFEALRRTSRHFKRDV